MHGDRELSSVRYEDNSLGLGDYLINQVLGNLNVQLQEETKMSWGDESDGKSDSVSSEGDSDFDWEKPENDEDDEGSKGDGDDGEGVDAWD